MQISYSSPELQKLCLEQRVAVRHLGADCAKKLRSRLADLMAAVVLGDVVAGRPHPLTGNRTGQFSLDLAGGVRLTFVPSGEAPRTESGDIAWRLVTEVTIVYIGDYHD